MLFLIQDIVTFITYPLILFIALIYKKFEFNVNNIKLLIVRLVTIMIILNSGIFSFCLALSFLDLGPYIVRADGDWPSNDTGITVECPGATCKPTFTCTKSHVGCDGCNLDLSGGIKKHSTDSKPQIVQEQPTSNPPMEAKPAKTVQKEPTLKTHMDDKGDVNTTPSKSSKVLIDKTVDSPQAPERSNTTSPEASSGHTSKVGQKSVHFKGGDTSPEQPQGFGPYLGKIPKDSTSEGDFQPSSSKGKVTSGSINKSSSEGGLTSASTKSGVSTPKTVSDIGKVNVKISSDNNSTTNSESSQEATRPNFDHMDSDDNPVVTERIPIAESSNNSVPAEGSGQGDITYSNAWNSNSWN